MAKKCFYCSCEIDNNNVVDMCIRCMHGVWGEKMSQAIIENMERESKTGNLDLGRVSEQEKRNNETVNEKIEHLEKEIHVLEDEVESLENEVSTLGEEVHDLEEVKSEKPNLNVVINDLNENDLNLMSNKEDEKSNLDIFRSESNFGI